jgi:hypothetical protein
MLLEELRDKIEVDAIHLAPQNASRLFKIQVGFFISQQYDILQYGSTNGTKWH